MQCQQESDMPQSKRESNASKKVTHKAKQKQCSAAKERTTHCKRESNTPKIESMLQKESNVHERCCKAMAMHCTLKERVLKIEGILWLPEPILHKLETWKKSIDFFCTYWYILYTMTSWKNYTIFTCYLTKGDVFSPQGSCTSRLTHTGSQANTRRFNVILLVENITIWWIHRV